jgi:hypothetical protein
VWAANRQQLHVKAGCQDAVWHDAMRDSDGTGRLGWGRPGGWQALNLVRDSLQNTIGWMTLSVTMQSVIN